VSRYALRIGGVTISVESDETIDVPEPAARFLVSPDAAGDVHLNVTRGAPAVPHGGLLFDSGAVWRLYRDGGRSVFTFSSPAFRSDPYKTASFDAEFTRGEIVLAPDVAPGSDPLEYPLDELLISTIFALRGNGAELHGCGIVVDGQGYLFVGQSGAGKTTTARLWLAETDSPLILSDDRILITEAAGGGFRMWGTPWHGEAEVCSAADAPLKAIYLLEQANATAIRQLEPSEAVARLFGCSFPLFYDAESISRSLRLFDKLAEERLVSLLAFAADSSAVRAVVVK
jgi:hypothetical protein